MRSVAARQIALRGCVVIKWASSFIVFQVCGEVATENASHKSSTQLPTSSPTPPSSSDLSFDSALLKSPFSHLRFPHQCRRQCLSCHCQSRCPSEATLACGHDVQARDDGQSSTRTDIGSNVATLFTRLGKSVQRACPMKNSVHRSRYIPVVAVAVSGCHPRVRGVRLWLHCSENVAGRAVCRQKQKSNVQPMLRRGTLGVGRTVLAHDFFFVECVGQPPVGIAEEASLRIS